MTPIYFKTSDNVQLPEDESAFLLLSGNGLWMCRNHEFFRSCAPARSWPCELAKHKASLELRHPKIPRRMFERIVGFFSAVAERHAAEAGVLLVWDKVHERMDLFVPRQLATVGKTWAGDLYPIGLHYDRPTDLGPECVIIADVHSHVYDLAYSSSQDKYDEEYLAGLHVVVGRLHLEPPDLHVEFVVDGYRFTVDPAHVLEGYESRCDDVPQAWLDLVSVKISGPGNSSTTINGWSTSDKLPPPPKNYPGDDEIIGESKSS
jgi:hypothetical protein